jgi:sugar phosphate isomerase/epimerase
VTIELALSPDSRWDITAAGLIAAARDAGFAALGLPEKHAHAACAALLAEAGLRCHEVQALVVSADEENTTRAAGRLAEAAAAVRAPWVLTVFTAPLDAATAPLIERCAAMLAQAGTGMAVEFSPLGPVPSLAAALDVVDVAGADRAGVVIDSWHFFRGDSDWGQLARIPLDRVAYIQFDDAPPPVSDNGMKETMHRRVMPGDGTFDLGRFAAAFLDRGWSGLVSVEVLSAELRQIPVPEFARLAYQASGRYWRQ